jgi:flagellar protein FliJ
MKRTDRLIQLKRYHLDAIKRRISMFAAMRRDLEGELANLDNNVAREKQRARDSQIGRLALPALLRSIEERREKLLTTLKEIEREYAATQLEFSKASQDILAIESAAQQLATHLAEMLGHRTDVQQRETARAGHR